MKIGIDLGHGHQTLGTLGGDGGAVGCIAEETIINDVGGLVISKLNTLGHEVIELRPTSASSVSDSLYKRYSKSDNNDCDWCISIHANASDGQGHGTEVFTYGAKEITEARAVLNNIVSLGFTDRGIKDGSGLAMVKRPQAKAMLIEICFCDNQSDFDIYNSVGIESIANAIVSGLTGQTLTSQYKQGWNQNSKGWFYCTDVDNGYYCKDAWKEINSDWYYFDSDGYALQNNWQLYQNKWYYLDKDCKMVKSKWISWKDEFYYVNEKGEMLVNCFTPDNYWVDSDGSWNNKAKGIK